MEAKNFRIGNLVGINKTALHADGCNIETTYFEIEELKKDIVQFKDFYAGEYYKDLKPIELTEDWLIRFGFECEAKEGDQNEFRVYRFGQITYNTNHGWWWKHQLTVQLKYVHELQNLFFTITGQELELKNECSTCG